VKARRLRKGDRAVLILPNVKDVGTVMYRRGNLVCFECDSDGFTSVWREDCFRLLREGES
jgi:hypothetical protein